MQIQGTHTFNAPRQIVWDSLMDPTILAMALPGGEALEKTGENEYKAALKVRVGPVQGKFDGAIELSEINELESYHMQVSGQGAPGFVNGGGDVRLEDAGAETIMHYSGDVQVGGKIAGVGQRLIDSTAKSMIRQGLTALDAQVEARAAAAAEPVPTASDAAAADQIVDDAGTTAAEATRPNPPAAPAAATPRNAPPPAGPSATQMATAVAKDVARDLASDVVPLHAQEKVLWFGLGAITMLVLVGLISLIF
ncbi:MAG: carbon monoxide dehydrogenase subunit G [Caldilineaceae bacterium]|nr:carbon monoxide dehydrogenase subunit G [Caldilineaceae bacterium]